MRVSRLALSILRDQSGSHTAESRRTSPLDTRRRVLIIAEAANPEWVSVPLIGWSLASALREVADVHLVTQVRNRDAILRAGLVEGKDFTVIDSEAISRPLWKVGSLLRMGKGKGWTMVSAVNALSYPYFEHLVWKRFGRDIRAGRFDVVHRVTPLSPATVSPIARKCARHGIPFVMGPLNGGVPWPPGFDAERRREREWLSYVRGAYRVLPGRGAMLAAARAIIVGSRIAASEVPSQHRDRMVYIPENAVDPDRFNMIAPQDTSGCIRACFIGRLVPLKGVDMLLEAAAPLLRDGHLTLDIVGDGPMRAALEAQVAAENIAPAVTFHGNIPHRQVQTIAARSNLLGFPSIREFGGGVVLEAMALGVVPIVVDYAGPGELVTPETGYKVPLGTRADIVSGFRLRLEEIVRDPSQLPVLATKARERVAGVFTWKVKARQIARVYEWVLDPSGPAPSFL
jgi:glycosyltransferase involved in cell wall biosynthesis